MTKSQLYVPREYRHWVKANDLVSFNIIVKETDLFIRATRNLQKQALALVLQYRATLEKYIRLYPDFFTSLVPVIIGNDSPAIIKLMAQVTTKVGVGPMASVAGAIAEVVGTELQEYAADIIIENGGDIYICSTRPRVIGLFAGNSPFSGKIGLEILPDQTPVGVCTSSGTVGHSLSFGKTDATIVVAKSAALADAIATRVGNIIKSPVDIDNALTFARQITGLLGIVIIVGDKIGMWGDIKICVI